MHKEVAVPFAAHIDILVAQPAHNAARTAAFTVIIIDVGREAILEQGSLDASIAYIAVSTASYGVFVFRVIAEGVAFGKEWKMRKDTLDGDPDKESQFYILKHTKCPAVLSENFFMDTERDCRFIMSHEGRERIAEVHFRAIKRIFDKYGKD